MITLVQQDGQGIVWANSRLFSSVTSKNRTQLIEPWSIIESSRNKIKDQPNVNLYFPFVPG